MEYIKRNSEAYRKIMDQYHIGSLLAKILAYYQWDDVKIHEFLEVGKGFDCRNHNVANAIKERILMAKAKNEKVFVSGSHVSIGRCQPECCLTQERQSDTRS